MKKNEQVSDLRSGPDTRSIPVETVDLGKSTVVEVPIVGDTAQGDGSGWKWKYDKPGQNK